MRLRPRSLLLLLGAQFAAHAALAQSATPATPLAPAAPASAPEAVLPAVPVRAAAERESASGPVQGYKAGRSATATKTDTPLHETPQAISVITRDQIVDQGVTNLQDALNYAAGVRSDAYGLDSRTDSARIRGGNPDEYLDGLRKLFNWYTSNGRTEPYTLERIEVLRGPSAMLYGQGSTGGVINMVGKRPQAEAQGEIGLQVGSFDRRQLQADVTGPLTADGQWLYRLVAVGRQSDTQVDHVPDDRRLLAPSLTWRPSAATSLTLQGLVQRDRTGSTSQFFPWEGVISPNPNGELPTNRFIGEPGWDRYDTDRESFGWLFEHRFGEAWTLRQNTRWTRNQVDYRSLYGDSFSLPGSWAGDPVNKRLFGRYAYADLNKVRMLAADQHVEGRLDIAGIKHQLLAGLDAVRFTQSGQSGFDSPVYAGGTVPLIDAYAPVYGGFTPPAMADKGESGQRHLGLYLQDQVKFASNWIVVAGLRHDRAVSEPSPGSEEKTSATSKRLGLMHAFDNGWSPYLSYSESFTPVASIGTQSFDPLRGKQWEAGVKYESPAHDGLAFSALVYDLKEKNGVVEVTPNVYAQLNETWARGAELEARGKLTPALELIGSYQYTELDKQLENAPRHQASVWGKWRFALAGVPGFSAGAGWRYLSAYADGAAPEVPDLNLLDLMLAWESPRWRAALNVSNATDKVYVANCLSRGDCWWGARRNAVASLTWRW